MNAQDAFVPLPRCLQSDVSVYSSDAGLARRLSVTSREIRQRTPVNDVNDGDLGLSAVLPPGARNPGATGNQGLLGKNVTQFVRDGVWVAVECRLKIAPLGGS
jgi:hypothetical protein